MTIYSLDVLCFLVGTSLLFHVQFLLLLSDLHIGFSRGRSGGLVFPSQNCPQFIVIHTVKGFSIVNEAEVDIFLEFSWFFYNTMDVGNLISDSSAFLNQACTSGSSWFTYCWSLAPRILSITFLACEMSAVCNCVVVCPFFGIALFWDWNENWPFPVLWPLLSFPNLLAYWMHQFHSIIF